MLKINSFYSSLLLLLSIFLGGFTGYYLGPSTLVLKPIGDLFLNIILTIISPVIFFSISSAITAIGNLTYLRKVLLSIVVVFILTSLTASCFMMIMVHFFPPQSGIHINSTLLPTVIPIEKTASLNFLAQLLQIVSRYHILILIFFSFLTGFLIVLSGKRGLPFRQLLQKGQSISMQLMGCVMYIAPLGFFSYFAVFVAELGPQFVKLYFHIVLFYYFAALIYFLLALTFFAYLADKKTGMITFWKNISFPLLTALATCSSAASIPSNLQAVKKMGVPNAIAELVIPLGSILHKDGSVLGAILKISLLASLFHFNFSSPVNFLFASLVSVLVGGVMGAIPSGGMMGELLILSMYGLPHEALMIIVPVGFLIDLPATLLNVSSNTSCCLLVARLIQGKNALTEPLKSSESI